MYLIKNDDQKFKTLRHIRDFERRLSEIRKDEGERAAQAFLQAYGTHIKELRQQLREYENLKQRRLPVRSFSNPTKLGGYLIKARIAAGLTQEKLAQKLGVSQPMIHKYELSEYAGCGLDLLTKAADALGIRITLSAGSKQPRRASPAGPRRRGASSKHA